MSGFPSSVVFQRGVITWTSETPEQAYSKYANVYHEMDRNESVIQQKN